MTSQALFVAHRDGVFRYLCRIVGQGEAPDLTQEVFLRVARSPVPETTSEGERAWVFRITPDAVRSRLHRTRQQLRTALQPLLSNGCAPHVRLYDPR